MTNEIVRAMDVDVNELQTVAKLLATSGYFEADRDPNKAIAQMAVKVLAGREMGFGPFASVQGIYLIQGKPTVSANLMASAVKNSPRYDYRVRKMDATECVLEFFERDAAGKSESIGVSSFNALEAKTAGVKNMDKFARNMLFARALSNGVRWYCPNVFNGNAVYIPEELGADVNGDGEIVTVQAVTPAAAAAKYGSSPETQAALERAVNGNGNEFKAFMAQGVEIFGDEWEHARHWLIRRWSTKETPGNVRESANELTSSELVALRRVLVDYHKGLLKAYSEEQATQAKELATALEAAVTVEAHDYESPFAEPA